MAGDVSPKIPTKLHPNLALPATQLTGTVAVIQGGTGVTTSTGTGSTVLSMSPSLVTPVLGTPTSGTLTNCTSYPIKASTVPTGVAAYPSFSACCSANTTATAGGYTKIGFDTAVFNVGSMYDTTNKKFLPTVAGIYAVTIFFYMSTHIANERYGIALYKNGSNYQVLVQQTCAVANVLTFSGSTLVSMNGTTDYIEAYCYNGNGVTNAVVFGNGFTSTNSFSGCWVGPNT